MQYAGAVLVASERKHAKSCFLTVGSKTFGMECFQLLKHIFLEVSGHLLDTFLDPRVVDLRVFLEIVFVTERFLFWIRARFYQSGVQHCCCSATSSGESQRQPALRYNFQCLIYDVTAEVTHKTNVFSEAFLREC